MRPTSAIEILAAILFLCQHILLENAQLLHENLCVIPHCALINEQNCQFHSAAL